MVSPFKLKRQVSTLIRCMFRRLLTTMDTTNPKLRTAPEKLEKLRTESGFKAKKQDIHSASANEDLAEYVISGPMRKVVPYYFTYLTYCKLRWRDRTLLDIFSTEFRDRSEEYYRKTIAAGEVLLNGKPAGIDTLVRNGDLISHKIHRHEPAVTSRPIRIVEETDGLVIIDKPAGIPVHPTGRYRYNTITKVMKLEMGLGEVHPCNRLDRLTSGLMFLAKTPQGADKFVEQLKQREVKKEYIARVKGIFPDDPITVEKPLSTLDPRLGLNVIDEEKGKEAKTDFIKISSDGHTSIVKCMPHTGRTHQIRVHLQYLGYPIANDPIYANEFVWGKDLGKDGTTIDYEKVKQNLYEVGKSVSASSWFYPDSKGEVLQGKQCDICGTELYTDPGPNDLDLWLHAYRYYSTGENQWSHQTSFPDWALETHTKYMELALDEAKKCGPTETAFSVGALLVKDGEILSTGYSRELPGNTHAEQCALDKYFENHNELPKGTVCYTTMEPCSLRLSGNLPCVDRILKTDIKAVFVGVVEPDTFVKNNVGLEKLREKGVEYIKVPGLEDDILKAAFKGHPDKE
ncbi:CYFA0S04e00144g1_1 [Cyberlindnera fabianii]|uniref:tRNA pseudouridine(32) synthase n=1 Tax=Cyberlindnera fabianii TaxID=36022 RepID=A0A061AWV2_CYBFA|nr:CYFA0S04e00144g1_1 [Cyberlindnera fabianii]